MVIEGLAAGSVPKTEDRIDCGDRMHIQSEQRTGWIVEIECTYC